MVYSDKPHRIIKIKKFYYHMNNMAFIQTRRALLITLAVLLIAAQWAVLEHDYHEHDHGEVCEICVGHSPIKQALGDSGTFVQATTNKVLEVEFSLPVFISTTSLELQARGPPSQLS